jgi:hypothetical protein
MGDRWLLGQKDTAMIERVYGHHSPDHLKGASAAIGRIAAAATEATLRVKKPRKAS